jgi:S-adenosylmethionine:tRNA ribosyltransferase-isomerase
MQNDSLFFDYDLPRERIAQQPLRNRADAKLLVVHRSTGRFDHLHVRDLPELLRAGDTLVMNETKVVPAQLVGHRKSTGGRWQGLYLRNRDDGAWILVCKTRGKLAVGEVITLDDREGRPAERLWLVERLEAGQWAAKIEGDAPADALLARVGRVPLPHYIRGGKMIDADQENYQTVFAKHPGAVAAPTAGLHFTRHLLVDLSSRGVQFAPVTLHVGLGTFRPVTAERPQDHDMHSEWGELSAASAEKINAAKAAGKRVVAIGTTSVRVLETAAAESAEQLAAWQGDSQLFIHPPYEFRAVDALMTNFHFPRTTLLLLVQAFAGSELTRAAYAEAIACDYRFYSYGDAMLIL